MSGANLAILLTPRGGAAIAVVRLAGPRVGEVLRSHFGAAAVEGRPVHGTLCVGGDVIDDPVVVLSAGGTVADLNLHGGAWVVRSVLEAAGRAGFEVVEGRELPVRAAAVDAETELEREVLTHLPLARTELALRALLAQAEAWANFKRQLAGAASAPSRVEVIQEGQVPRAHAQSIPTVARPPRPQLLQILADSGLLHLLHPPRVAIVGAPNVGKSTLANRLFAQERSITADLPGTTRDWVGEIANVDGLAVMLLDTPGLRGTGDPIERAAIAGGRAEIGRADLVVLVLDAARPLEPDQAPLLEAFPAALRVVNKADRPAEWDAGSVGAVATVATTGEGVPDLRARIAARFGCAGLDPSQPRWWTPRQREVLGRAVDDPGALNDL